MNFQSVAETCLTAVIAGGGVAALNWIKMNGTVKTLAKQYTTLHTEHQLCMAGIIDHYKDRSVHTDEEWRADVITRMGRVEDLIIEKLGKSNKGSG